MFERVNYNLDNMQFNEQNLAAYNIMRIEESPRFKR